MTALGLRWVRPFGIFPAGRIQARLAVTPQFQPLGTPGATPAKIIPSKSPNPHMSCCGASTSHDDPGTESCAFRYDTGAQPAGGAAGPPAGTAIVAGDAVSAPTGPIRAAATATAATPIAATSQPRPIR